MFISNSTVTDHLRTEIGSKVYSLSFANRQLRAVHQSLARLKSLSDAELKSESRTLQYKARSGQSTRSLLPRAFAVLSETTRRVYSMVPYDVQLLGGIHLCSRNIVEMATGEGKTLTALLPLYLRSLEGKGMLLATSNDYLASRIQWTVEWPA